MTTNATNIAYNTLVNTISWMGVSVENDPVKDRIDYLRQTNAYIKFLSLEPLIAPLSDLNLQNIDWQL